MNKLADRMTTALAALICAAAIATAPAAAAATGDQWSIRPFEISYKVKVGIASAEATVALRALADNRFEIESVTEARGIASLFKRGSVYERATFRYEGGAILAETLVRRDTLSPEERSCEVVYYPQQGYADVTFKGETDRVEIPEGTVNPLLMQIALMQAMALGERPTRYMILDHAGLQPFAVQFGERGTVETPVGSFSAIPVDLINETKAAGTTMWAAPDENWLAVQVEARKDNEVKARLLMQNLVRPDPAPTASAR
jgi:hypothetical protein